MNFLNTWGNVIAWLIIAAAIFTYNAWSGGAYIARFAMCATQNAKGHGFNRATKATAPSPPSPLPAGEGSEGSGAFLRHD